VIFCRLGPKEEDVGIMLQQKFGGSAFVNGGERRLTVVGNPLGRTMIQVDGVTVFTKSRSFTRRRSTSTLFLARKLRCAGNRYRSQG
jgi:hypothetical protein